VLTSIFEDKSNCVSDPSGAGLVPTLPKSAAATISEIAVANEASADALTDDSRDISLAIVSFKVETSTSILLSNDASADSL